MYQFFWQCIMIDWWACLRYPLFLFQSLNIFSSVIRGVAFFSAPIAASFLTKGHWLYSSDVNPSKQPNPSLSAWRAHQKTQRPIGRALPFAIMPILCCWLQLWLMVTPLGPSFVILLWDTSVPVFWQSCIFRVIYCKCQDTDSLSIFYDFKNKPEFYQLILCFCSLCS